MNLGWEDFLDSLFEETVVVGDAPFLFLLNWSGKSREELRIVVLPFL